MTDYDLYYAIGKYVMEIWERNICTPEEILATLSFTNLIGDLTRDGYTVNELLHISQEELQQRIKLIGQSGITKLLYREFEERMRENE